MRRDTIALVPDEDITIGLDPARHAVTSGQEASARLVTIVGAFHLILGIEVLSAHDIILQPSLVGASISLLDRATGPLELSSEFLAILE